MTIKLECKGKKEGLENFKCFGLYIAVFGEIQKGKYKLPKVIKNEKF